MTICGFDELRTEINREIQRIWNTGWESLPICLRRYGIVPNPAPAPATHHVKPSGFVEIDECQVEPIADADHLVIYTDGACSNQRYPEIRNAAGAWAAFANRQWIAQGASPLPGGNTNNVRAETWAWCLAMAAARRARSIQIVTDSETAMCAWFSRSAREGPCRDLWRILEQLGLTTQAERQSQKSRHTRQGLTMDAPIAKATSLLIS